MIKAKPVKVYATSGGKEPFTDWVNAIRSPQDRARIENRIRRLRQGHVGDCEPVGEGVHELRLFFGPGYRIYFSEYKREFVILLCGGDKKTQVRDIQKAKDYWREYKESRR